MNSKKSFALKILLIWTSLHLLGFVLAETKMDFFDSSSSIIRNEGFWPFVAIVELPKTSKRAVTDVGRNIVGFEEFEQPTQFNGIFYHYDSTELFTYLILGFLVFGLFLVDNIFQNKE